MLAEEVRRQESQGSGGGNERASEGGVLIFVDDAGHETFGATKSDIVEEQQVEYLVSKTDV
jgi:hypothetical protein